jgi:hypothetical protein
MSGYRDDDEHEPLVEWEDWRAASNILFAPVFVGAVLVFEGIASRTYLMAAGGVLVLGAVAAMAYIGSRRQY